MTDALEGLRAFAQKGSSARQRAAHPGLLVLAAGKGGVGTSTLAVLLANTARTEGMRTLLVDAAEGPGTLHHLTSAGADPAGLAQLDGGTAGASELIVTTSTGVDLLPAGRPEPDDEILSGPGRRAAVLRRASAVFASYDVVLVDAGSRMSALVAAATIEPGGLSVVTTAEPVALAGCYAVLKVARQRLPHLAPQVVVTGRDPAAAAGTHEIIRSASSRFLGIDVELAGSVPADADLAARVRAGDSPWRAGSPSAAAAATLLGRLLPWMSGPLPDIRPQLAFPRG